MAAGDVLNTAARLQTAAPVNGVLVGEQTYRATSDVIDYREAEPVDRERQVGAGRRLGGRRARARASASTSSRSARRRSSAASRELELLGRRARPRSRASRRRSS